MTGRRGRVSEVRTRNSWVASTVCERRKVDEEGGEGLNAPTAGRKHYATSLEGATRKTSTLEYDSSRSRSHNLDFDCQAQPSIST